ncbi:MAG: LysR family transcriptional regulator [Povalibacter sp.]
MPSSPEHWHARIGRHLRLRDLHVLLTVVQSGSMAKAARHLSISQPAVSKAIGDLESAVGVRLLDRSSRGVEPTSYGAALIKRGIAAFDELRHGIAEMEFLAGSNYGSVTIGCNESLSAALLPKVISRLGSQYPGITVHVVQLNRPINEEIGHLRQRSVDLILARGLFRVTEGDLECEVLFDESLVVVAGAHHPLVKRRKLSLAELAGIPWIFYPPNEPPGTLVEQAFHSAGISVPKPALTTSSFHLRKSLLCTGDYVTVVPACMLSAFNVERRVIKALPVSLNIPNRPVAIFTLKGRTLSPACLRAMECIRQAAAAFTKMKS